jgi:hypothetical protein
LLEEVLKRMKTRLGPDHPETLNTLANLGVNYRDAGRLDEALPLLEAAARASRQNPALRWVGAELVDGYIRAGETAKGAALARELVAEARAAFAADSLQLAGALAINGTNLLRLKAWADAEPLLRECLAIREREQPDAWTTFNTQSLLGGALLGQARYADAEPLLLRGYEGMRQLQSTIPPQGQVRLTEALERLVQLYQATGEKAKAADWQTKLDTARQAPQKPRP